MKSEVLRILKMVEEGKIDSEVASKLIDSLEDKTEENNNQSKISNKENVEKVYNEFVSNPKLEGEKMLYVFVYGNGDNKVKVKLPIKFIKAVLGATNSENIPGLKNTGVDIEVIKNAIDNGLEGRIVEIESEEGDTVIIEIK